MNMKWFKKYALPAVLAAVVPITANAAPYVAPDVTLNNPAVTGKTLTQITGIDVNGKVWTSVFRDAVGVVAHTDPYEGETIATFSNTYNLGKVNITSNVVTGHTLGVLAKADYSGTYNLSDINITKTGAANGMSIGFYFNDEVDAFTGKILGKANITIADSTADAGDTMYGAELTTHGKAFAGTAEFGTITIKDSQSGSIGIEVADVAEKGSITADKIDVTTAVNAVGLSLFASNATGEKGSIKIGEINAEGAYAAGVITDPDFANYQDSAVNIELGKVDAVANAGIAYGIKGANLTNITLTDDITATSETGAAYGIDSESVMFNVAEGKTVDISGNSVFGSAGIRATGDYTTDSGVFAFLGKGSVLDVDMVDVSNGGAFVTEGYGKAKIGGLREGADSYIDVLDESSVELNADAAFLNNAPGSLYVEKGASFIATTSEKDKTTLEGAADLLATKLGDNFDDEVGLVELFSDAAIMHFNGDGTYTNRGPGLANGFVAAASMHQRYSAWNATRDQMISAGSNRRGFLGQECDPCDPVGACDPCDPCGKFGFGGAIGGAERSLARNAWVNYVGRADEYSTPLGDKWKLGMDGVQVGTDLYKTSRNQFGVLFGYEGGDLVSDRSRVEGDDIYAGIYGAHVFNNGFDLRGTFAYGWQDYKMVRQAFGAGALYGAKFDGTTTESTVEIGKRFFNGNWSMRPVFGLDVMSNELGKAQEYLVANNNVQGYTYGKTDFTQVFLRAGTDLRWQLRRLTFNSGIYYSYDVDGDRLLANAQWSDPTTAPITLAGSDMGRELLTFNVGGEYQFNHFSVFGGYQGQAVLDTDSNAYQSIGYVGGAWKW